MIIRFLGTHSAEAKDAKLVSILIDGVLALDAGSLGSELTFPEQEKIKALLLSHGHYDHIRGVPAFAFSNSRYTTEVCATAQTLQILSSHLLDGIIYPEFANGNSFLGKAALKFTPIEPFKPMDIEGYRVLAIPMVHPIDAVGFEITSGDGKKVFYTGDTGPGLSAIWEHVSPQLLIIEVSVPNRLEQVAQAAGHLCPELLKKELTEFSRIKGYLPRVILIHLRPQHKAEIGEEIEQVAAALNTSITIANDGQEVVV